MSVERRVAVVTGGAGAIGQAIAQSLATASITVALFDLSPAVGEMAADLNPAVGETAAPQGPVGHCGVEVDITEAQAVDAAVAAVTERYGRLDILVNCAGVALRPEGRKPTIAEVDADSWRRSIEVNLTSVFLCSRAVIPAMRAGGWGRIVTLSSQGGRTGGIFSSVDYGAAKAGVIGFSRTLAVEVGRYGITVNCVAPGRVRSPMTAYGSEEQANDAFLQSLPVARMAETSEVAAAVCFLCSEQAGYITGATLDVNGGGFMG